MHPSPSFRFLATLFAAAFGQQATADELPPGLDMAIRNPAIPMIVDATILKFNKEGHAEIKVNAVYKSPRDKKGTKVAPPTKVRGYAAIGKVVRVHPLAYHNEPRANPFPFLSRRRFALFHLQQSVRDSGEEGWITGGWHRVQRRRGTLETAQGHPQAHP